jgi:hypothetical protein
MVQNNLQSRVPSSTGQGLSNEGNFEGLTPTPNIFNHHKRAISDIGNTKLPMNSDLYQQQPEQPETILPHFNSGGISPTPKAPR